MEEAYYVLAISIFRFAESYQLELSRTNPEDQAKGAPLRGSAAFDLTELLKLQNTPAEYGQELSHQLFSDENVKQYFLQVEAAAASSKRFLRLTLCIDPSAQELHSLRWELLYHPMTHTVLSTSEKLLFSRFMVSRDFWPVKLRTRTELSALLAVAAPPAAKLQELQLAPVDFESEVSRIKGILGEIRVRTLGGPTDPCTVDRLIEELRTGVDIVYLVSHGRFGRTTGMPALVLQDDKGGVQIVKGDDLSTRISELQTTPRMMVLASCQSAGDGNPVDAGQRTSVQATLAARLADAGVPAIIGMQGFITMETIEKMMPVFFKELVRDGQIDRALAAARSKVRERDDAWMPALYMRLTAGRLWYTTGFQGNQSPELWRLLLAPVRDGKVVPILGPRLLEAAYGSSHETARRLAGSNHYPLAAHEWDDLPRVAEYLRVKRSRYDVLDVYRKQILMDLIRQHRHWLPASELPPVTKQPDLNRLLTLVGEHLRQDNSNDPYRILASLPASIYVTTNFDSLLEQALTANQRKPRQLLTRWRYDRAPQMQENSAPAEPTRDAPLVYHAFGAFGAFGQDTDDGLVLTADDYFKYLIDTSAAKLIPTEVESALVDNALMFLGFRLTDWHFRVLFRLMMNLPGRDRLKKYRHVAVQLDPDMQTMADVAGAKCYLAEYFKEASIDIYWGSAEDFLKVLRDELKKTEELTVEATPAKKAINDEWEF